MSRMRFDYFGDEDGHRPEPGDLIVTERLVYRVTFVRPIESQQWHDRWHVEMDRLGPKPVLNEWAVESTAMYGSCALISTRRYERGETPQDFARRLVDA